MSHPSLPKMAYMAHWKVLLRTSVTSEPSPVADVISRLLRLKRKPSGASQLDGRFPLLPFRSSDEFWQFHLDSSTRGPGGTKHHGRNHSPNAEASIL